MSTLTEKITEALIPHDGFAFTEDEVGSLACKAGHLLPGDSRANDRLTAHLAEVAAAVVAEWLISDNGARAAVSTLPHLHLVGGIHEMPCEKVHCTEPTDALARVTALAAEAVQQADA